MCRFFVVSYSGYYDYINRMDAPALDLPLAENAKRNAARPTATAVYSPISYCWGLGFHSDKLFVMQQP